MVDDQRNLSALPLPALLDVTTRLREATAESRRSYAEGTPEKYPGAQVSGFTILDAEALLAHIETMYRDLEHAYGYYRETSEGRP